MAHYTLQVINIVKLGAPMSSQLCPRLYLGFIQRRMRTDLLITLNYVNILKLKYNR